MPALVAPDQTEIDTWRIREAGVKDGSSPKVTFDVSGSVATRQVFCLWRYRHEVARWFVGAVDSYMDGTTKKLSRLNPQQLPLPAGSPLWVPRFYATKVTEISGHCWQGNDPDDWDRLEVGEDGEPGSPTGEAAPAYQFTEDTVNKFTHALLTIQYERLPFTLIDDEEGDPEIVRNVQFIPEEGQPEIVTAPTATQNYISPTGTGTGHGVPIPYPVGITESTYKFTLRWHRIPYDCYGPGSALTARLMGDGTTANLPFLNALNDAPFYYNTFPAGTVMLEKVTEKLDPSLLDGSTYLWTIDYTFAVKPAGWNSLWFFPNANEFTGAGNAAKRMFAGRGTAHYAAGSVPDLYSNFIERDFEQLFNVDDGV